MADWLLVGSNTDHQIHKYDGFSSTVLESLTETTGPNSLGACTWDEPDNASGNLIFQEGDTGLMKRSNAGFSLTVGTSFAATTFVYTSHWDHDSDNLLVQNSGSKFREQSGFSATVSASFTAGTTVRGVTSDNSGNVYSSDVGGGAKIRKHTGFSATIDSSFTPTGGSNSIAFDGTNVIINYSGSIKLLSGFSATVTSSFTHPDSAGEMDGLDWVPEATAASSIKEINGLAQASVKEVNGLAIASVKSVNGLSNVS